MIEEWDDKIKLHFGCPFSLVLASTVHKEVVKKNVLTLDFV